MNRMVKTSTVSSRYFVWLALSYFKGRDMIQFRDALKPPEASFKDTDINVVFVYVIKT